MITEPNFIIFELFLVISVLRLQTELFLDLLGLGSKCEPWISESLVLLYRNVLGMMFGGEGNDRTDIDCELIQSFKCKFSGLTFVKEFWRFLG